MKPNEPVSPSPASACEEQSANAQPSAAFRSGFGMRAPSSYFRRGGVRAWRLAANPVVDEPLLAEPGRVVDVAAVEDHRGPHDGLHVVEVRLAELVPLGHQEDRL